ncbi:MAG: glucose-1-phosphate thymidylyltransferase (strD) [Gemmataceae bacterium]
MDAIVLAAGLGKRLRPHTLETPKPLLPVQGRPILDWILDALPRQVRRVLVVVSYLADRIEKFIQARNDGRVYMAVHQAQPRGTGDALKTCQPYVESSRFLVLNGDDLYAAADLGALAQYEAAMLAYPVDTPWLYGVVFTRLDGTLDRLVEKPQLSGRHLANIGAYCLPYRVFDIEIALSPRGEYEITDYVTQLAQRQPLAVVPATFWYPIGTVEAWQRTSQLDLSPLVHKATSRIRN